MVRRQDYLNILRTWRNAKVIKVITGLRRCGKSTLLKQFQEELIRSGVMENSIIFLNLEALENEALLNYASLHSYIVERLVPGQMNYIFLDEVQLVPDFQRAVDSLYLREDVDIYITGSNAYLLSGELATLLSGRYIEINMLPFSFGEYCSIRPDSDPSRLFADYQRYGALPYIAMMDDAAERADTYLEGIYNTVIVKDIEARQARKLDDNGRRITDMALLRSIARFLSGAISSPISIRSIADYITSSGRRISQSTVSDYLEALTEPYLFYPIERYDVPGKQLLRQNRKFYIVDLGLRRQLIAKGHYDLGFSLENTICLELKRRGYTVYTGKVGSLEVDFVARKGDEVRYVQVSASLLEESVFDREMAPLRAIRDNHPKTILTLDTFTPGDYDGIRVINAIDWLLE